MKKTILALGMFVFVALASQAQEQKPVATPVKPSDAPVVATPPASKPAVSSKDSAEFKFDVMEYNFGTINQGDVVNYNFNFTNNGKEPLVIAEAHGSCGCTVPDYPKQPIKKGEKAVVKVTFNSTGKSGVQDKTVTISSNAKNTPHVLHLKGTVNVPAKKEEAPAEKKEATPVVPEKK